MKKIYYLLFAVILASGSFYTQAQDVTNQNAYETAMEPMGDGKKGINTQASTADTDVVQWQDLHMQAFQNPAYRQVHIEFFLPAPAQVDLKVFDKKGNEIITLLDRTYVEAGEQTVVYDVSLLPSGDYTYLLHSEHGVKTGNIKVAK
jgi:hypothetical protein